MTRAGDERSMEEYLLRNPQSIGVARWLGCQLQLDHGRIDLLGEYPDGDWALVEVKATEGNEGGALQLLRYAIDLEDVQSQMYADGEPRPAIHKVMVCWQRMDETKLMNAIAAGVKVYVYRMSANYDEYIIEEAKLRWQHSHRTDVTAFKIKLAMKTGIPFIWSRDEFAAWAGGLGFNEDESWIMSTLYDAAHEYTWREKIDLILSEIYSRVPSARNLAARLTGRGE
jgi:hypothetical protein